MTYQIMKKICSAHHKRGERVREFNLAPDIYDKFRKKRLVYRERYFDLVSENWENIDGVYIMRLETSIGVINIRHYYYIYD